jgi:hypothetical protein
MAARERAVRALLLSVIGACASSGYQSCPVEWSGPLPDDAFARCRTVLLRRYGKLDTADPERFLLQTPWVPVDDPTGERRIALFPDPQQPGDLAVVVELRWPEVPLVGPPRWAIARGDAAEERALAAELRAELSAGS